MYWRPTPHDQSGAYMLNNPGEKMYTLEDDKETTSSLRKRNAGGPFIAPSANADSSPGSPPVGAQFIAPPPNGEDAQHISLGKQVTNSFKKITTPANAQANNKGVALAALTIACIGVFFTAMD